MPYTDFKSAGQVAKTFKLKIQHKEFLQEKNFEVNSYLQNELKDNFNNSLSFISESVICENLISPIIRSVAKENNLFIWSHTAFNVDVERNLTGVPDYLFGIKDDYDDSAYKSPIVCLGEAKKENFAEAWGQVIAEMYAAQIENKNKEIPIFGLVSNGEIWKFAVLKDDIVQIDINSFAAPRELQGLFNALNWVFCEARKSIDMLEKNN